MPIMSSAAAYPLSAAIAARLDALETAGSTNAELVRAAGEREHGAVMVTLDQTAGRGRLDRSWIAPAGQCLAASVLLRPAMPSGGPLSSERYGWFPLIAGLCLAESIAEVLGEQAAADARVALKWPNDVHVGGRKIAGVLAELVFGPDGRTGVVVGTGVNLTVPGEALPTPTATSLLVEGVEGDAAVLADAVLAGYLRRLLGATEAFAAAAGDAGRAGLLERVRAVSATPGRRVRVVREGRADALADALRIDDDGRLLVRHDDGALEALAAGDVTHLLLG